MSYSTHGRQRTAGSCEAVRIGADKMLFDVIVFIIAYLTAFCAVMLYYHIENVIIRHKQRKELQRFRRSLLRRFKMRTAIMQRRGI